MKQISVIISPSGGITVETTGFQGKSCQDATKQLEEALGKKSKELLKGEFYQEAQAGFSINANG